MSLSFDIVWKFVTFWVILAAFTGVSNLSFAVMNTDNLINQSLQPQEVNLDEPSVGTEAISTNVRLPNSQAEWVTFLYQAMKLDSNVWHGWSNWIRDFFLIGSGVFGLFVMWDGISLLTSFIRGRP